MLAACFTSVNAAATPSVAAPEPLYAHQPEEWATLRLGTHLMLPVAKNGVIPPRG